MWHTKMHFSAKCNSGCIAIQWFHVKHYLDYQYTKFQPYTFWVQKMCVFARYATLVPRLFSSIGPCYAKDWNHLKGPYIPIIISNFGQNQDIYVGGADF